MMLLGLGGDAVHAPENTMVAYWAALGGGASGIAPGVRMTHDGVAVCVGHDTLEATCGDPRRVDTVSAAELAGLDAGGTFRSTELDASGRPTGARGDDTPWAGGRTLAHPRLDEVLKVFGRRSALVLMLGDGAPVMEATARELVRFGLLSRVIVAGGADTVAAASATGAVTALVADATTEPANAVREAADRGARHLVVDEHRILSADGGLDPHVAEECSEHGVTLILTVGGPSVAPSLQGVGVARGPHGVGLLARGVLPTVERVTPPTTVWHDTFDGNEMDHDLWAAGYSHANDETTLYLDDGFHVDIAKGRQYSGGGAVTVPAIHGRFDAQVEFSVSNPQQATTLELAAIGIDAGYHHMDNSNLNTRSVSLTFDVHGAPPYASSERDEDDGFRCGWNNGFNLTKIDNDFGATSVNMYNKYGRNVGDGSRENPDGWLRLVRNGSVVTTYYRDKHNAGWVCSGAVLVPSLAEDVHLRIAAKHWGKPNLYPKNHVVFREFMVRQF